MVKLVVIDDQEALRDGLIALLEQARIEIVGTAASAAAAADTVRNSEPDVALIATSITDGSALVLTRELVAEHPHLKVILFAEEVSSQAVYDGIGAGASGYALKRASLGELSGAIERVAAGGSYIDPRLDHRIEATHLNPRPQLSNREREVLTLMADGLTAEIVGGRLGISVETVRTHTRNAIRKTGARNRVHAITMSLVNGEIELPEASD
jgi:DNA-binding NarL/FixJ family response regulator